MEKLNDIGIFVGGAIAFFAVILMAPFLFLYVIVAKELFPRKHSYK